MKVPLTLTQVLDLCIRGLEVGNVSPVLDMLRDLYQGVKEAQESGKDIEL